MTGPQSKERRRLLPFSGLWIFQEPEDSVQHLLVERSRFFEKWRKETMPEKPWSNTKRVKIQNRKKFRRENQLQPPSKWSGSVAQTPGGSNRGWSVTPADTALPNRPPCETIWDHTLASSLSHVAAASKCSPKLPTGTVMRSSRAADYRRWLWTQSSWSKSLESRDQTPLNDNHKNLIRTHTCKLTFQ